MAATSGVYEDEVVQDAWEDVPVFGGTVLATVGFFQFFEGLSAVLKDQVYVATRDYVYQFDISAWGWVHLIMGVIALAVGIAILMRQTWAIAAGIVIAVLSLLAQFLFIPWQPLWAMAIMAIDVAVIWTLSARLSSR